MPLLTAAPILAFLEQQPTISFYEKLGFTCNANWDGYLMFHRDQISIHLWRCDDENIPKNTGCYIYVDEIDALYKECSDLGIVHPNGKLETKPWKLRQFSILDNSGNIIHFGQHLV
ncbi:MAG: VOC family protein [Chitinophagaceae bacterium]|nr:MAG: VOC family protein [Chitinophagaceae bacterium]